MKPKLLVSACLLGIYCRYDGSAHVNPGVLALAERYEIVPVCPEQLGGLATPRDPAERMGEKVVTNKGLDVTDRYRRGAEESLRLARLLRCSAAVLKERSPSCGHDEIYDGTFSHRIVPGDGVTAELLRKNGIRVLGESELELL